MIRKETIKSWKKKRFENTIGNVDDLSESQSRYTKSNISCSFFGCVLIFEDIMKHRNINIETLCVFFFIRKIFLGFKILKRSSKK